MSTSKKLILGTAAGLVAMLGALAPAMAKGGHHRHFRVWAAPVYVRSGCDFYYWKWQNTGNPYWKSKYYRCMY